RTTENMVNMKLAALLFAGLSSATIHPLLAQGGILHATRDLFVAGEFSRIEGIAVDPGGRFLVSQPEDGRVLLFSDKGKQLGAFGRKGQGPSEFVRIGRIGTSSSGFWIYDAMGSRLTMVSSQLEHPRMLPLSGSTVGSGAFVLARGNGDSLIVRAGNRGPGDRTETGASFLSISGSQGKSRLLGKLPNSPECIVVSGTWTTRVPYCERRFADASQAGERIVLVDHESPDAGYFVVTAISAAGDTIFSRRIVTQPIRIGRHSADSILDERANGSPPPLAKIIRTLVRLPTSFPPVRRIVAGRDGSTWLELQPPKPGHFSLWTVLDKKGTVVGRLELPGSFRLLAAETDRVWGVERDTNDVEAIARYVVK
ncbi:MAG: hypothetical protein ABIS00_14635, partial [Gemmatimonadales bacterium]